MNSFRCIVKRLCRRVSAWTGTMLWVTGTIRWHMPCSNPRGTSRAQRCISFTPWNGTGLAKVSDLQQSRRARTKPAEPSALLLVSTTCCGAMMGVRPPVTVHAGEEDSCRKKPLGAASWVRSARPPYRRGPRSCPRRRRQPCLWPSSSCSWPRRSSPARRRAAC